MMTAMSVFIGSTSGGSARSGQHENRTPTGHHPQEPSPRSRRNDGPVIGSDLLLDAAYLILVGMHTDLASAVKDGFSQARAELEELVRIPSVSAPGFDPGQVRRSAEKIASLLEATGFSDVHLLEIEGAHPAVYGEIPAPEGAPTVLLYAHHDVQPPGPDEEWDSTPFDPIEHDGRLLGRGTADDKCGVVMHLAAVRAFGGDVPVGVKIFMEGEEEIGSANLEAYLEQNKELLEADVIVIGDACATRNIVYKGDTVKAADVQASTLGSIEGYYGKVMTTEEFLKQN